MERKGKSQDTGVLNTSSNVSKAQQELKQQKAPLPFTEVEQLTKELQALNKLSISGRDSGTRSNKLTLAIMNKEQQLHQKLNPGTAFPSLTGRDTLGVGYATSKEARAYARKNKI